MGLLGEGKGGTPNRKCMDAVRETLQWRKFWRMMQNTGPNVCGNPLWTGQAETRRRNRFEMGSYCTNVVKMCGYVRPLVRLRQKVVMESPLVVETPAGLLLFRWSVAIFETEFCCCSGSIRKMQTPGLLSGSCAVGGTTLLPRRLQNGTTVYRCQFDLLYL